MTPQELNRTLSRGSWLVQERISLVAAVIVDVMDARGYKEVEVEVGSILFN
jgi:hypothetical protein